MRGSESESMTYERFKRLSEENLAACDNFLSNWQRLSQEGCCDSPYGTEFERVFLEYLKANKPMPVGEFIRERANLPALQPEPGNQPESEVTP